ncbi:beta-apo-4'-carotenal oxygenase [Geosmithia morbida]|uniref:Aldehyde dehydrogenase n=1 Tax=Geosmithia morbida TaxID=1094350 RepID=A0A9P4YZ85_9HYPO|nr:beta-apo-4'-carotenal oxygenase [Geosmithia morbida]KAF4125796.1 beta-apo-4'-carotenal oxygenase [Geosmithia morbida]
MADETKDSTSTTLVLPPFQPSAAEDIGPRHAELRASFRAGRTKDMAFRIQQLRKLYWAVVDLEPLLVHAAYKDFRKAPHETVLTETSWIKSECLDMIDNMEEWSRDQPVVGVPASFWPMKHRQRTEPLGTVLVIGAFNYPYQLTLLPMVGALAAGNTVLVKPSESAPHSAMAMRQVVERLDRSCYACVNGGLPVSQALLDLEWDKIVFTGGRSVGRIVAQKAAETLTPTLLELGGRNPAFVAKGANVELAARRLLWGKSLNGGQVCISHNYALVDRSLVGPFIGQLNRQYRSFMPRGAKSSPDFCRIINRAGFDRIKAMVDNSNGKIVMGGAMDADDLFIEPTVVLTEDINDSMMTEESFGPVWSIVPYDSLDDAIDLANKVDSTPLALFAFGNDKDCQKILNSVTSGGATVNDSYMHSSIPCAPFGGVGKSGNGTYHGYYSFKAFSHQRTIAKVPAWADALLRVRYMPYSPKDLSRYQYMNSRSINFDRQGNVVKGFRYWVSLILCLGGQGVKGTLVRWVALLAIGLAGLRSRLIQQ